MHTQHTTQRTTATLAEVVFPRGYSQADASADIATISVVPGSALEELINKAALRLASIAKKHPTRGAHRFSDEPASAWQEGLADTYGHPAWAIAERYGPVLGGLAWRMLKKANEYHPFPATEQGQVLMLTAVVESARLAEPLLGKQAQMFH